jgi:hypothetical protein
MSETLGFPKELVSLMATMSKNQAVLNTVAKNAALRDPAASIKALIEAGAKVDYDELVTALAPLPAVFKEVLPLAIAKNPTYDFIRTAAENGLPVSALIPVIVDGKKSTTKIPQLLAREQQWSVLLRLLDDKVFTLEDCDVCVSQLLSLIDCSSVDLNTPFRVLGYFGNQLYSPMSMTPLRLWVSDNVRHIDVICKELMLPEHRLFAVAVIPTTDSKDLKFMLSAAHNYRWSVGRAGTEGYVQPFVRSEHIYGVLTEGLKERDMGGNFILSMRSENMLHETWLYQLVSLAVETA